MATTGKRKTLKLGTRKKSTVAKGLDFKTASYIDVRADPQVKEVPDTFKNIETLQALMEDYELTPQERVKYGQALAKLRSKVKVDLNPVETVADSGITTAVQMGRLSGLDDSVQLGIQNVLEGTVKQRDLDYRIAVSQFENVTGIPAKEFASRMNVSEQAHKPNSADMKMALSVLGNADAYMAKGPGSNLAGYQPTAERTQKDEDDMRTAFGYLDDLTSLYIHKDTVGSRVEGARRLAVSESLAERFMNSTSGPQSKTLLPLPNETGVLGIVPTMTGAGYGTGTSFDRKSFEQEFGHLSIRGEDGKYQFKEGVSEEEQAEFWENRPDLKQSLFSNVKGGKEAKKRTKNFMMDQAQFKAEFITRVFKTMLPTHRDESEGNKLRTAGFDRPYGEQAINDDLRNEANLLGLEWADPAHASEGAYVDTLRNREVYGKGSDRSTAYGEKQFSEVDEYVEQTPEIAEQKELDRVAKLESEGKFAQRSPGWFKQRKGNITASVADMLDEDMGVEKMAYKLAMEREGLGSKFRGNAHTREGQDGEGIALNAFLSKEGKHLRNEEAYFETNEDIPGFGVSPDGRLYNKETGKSEGILELKYLTTGRMKGSAERYENQLQLQMAITKETQAHFFALDKYRNESIHKIVKADPEAQKRLIEAGTLAQEMQKGLTLEGIKELEKKIAMKGRVPNSSQGQNVSFSKGLPEEMDTFDPTNMVGPPRTTASGSMHSGEDIGSTGDAVDLPDEELDKLEQELGQTASSLQNFRKATSDATGVLAKLAKFVLEGNDSAMDTMQFAASTGMTAESARGIEYLLQTGEGGMDLAGARSTMRGASDLRVGFQDITKTRQTYGDLTKRWSGSELNKTVGALPDISWFAKDSTSVQDYVAWEAEMMQGQSDTVKRNIAQATGFGAELTMNRVDPDEIKSASGYIDQEGHRQVQTGRAKYNLGKQDVQEAAAAAGGSVGGFTAEAAIDADAAADSIGKLSKFALGSVASTGTYAKYSKQINKAGKLATTAARLTPVAAIAGLTTVAAREVLGVKDDNSAADTGLDILEMAAWGAAAGSIVPGVGTAVGAAVGAGVGLTAGLATEAYQYFSSDDEELDNSAAIPTRDIEGKPAVQQTTITKAVIENVELNVEVDPDMVKSTVKVDGKEYMDQENTFV